jgi:hypothetical protein
VIKFVVDNKWLFVAAAAGVAAYCVYKKINVVAKVTEAVADVIA